jgi:hypothetical protein
MRTFFILFSLCLSLISTAQLDTLQKDLKKSKWNVKPISPLKASVFSAILPGGGQIYNGIHTDKKFLGKFWKVPVVYAGIGTCLAFIQFNTQQYQYYKRQYLSSVDNDPNTIAEVNASTESINRVQDQYHRWMDLSYICLAGIYVLQIIEANVAAHLFYFNVSPDLSIQLHPALLPNNGRPLTGLSLGISTRSKRNASCKLR